MTNTDELNNNMAKALNGESFKTPDYGAVGIAVMTIDGTTEQLTDETGTRVATSSNRTNNVVTVTWIRSGTDVVDTVNGDDIKSIGVFNTSASTPTDKLLTGVSVSGLRQTLNFDIETEIEYTVNRR